MLDIEALRADTPGCRNVTHLNNAGSALQPAIVTDTVVAHLRREEQVGGYEAHAEARDRVAGTYASVGALVNAPIERVALVARGGVLGILPPIERPPGERPYEHIPPTQLAASVRLILHAVDVMGPAHVGIGTHFNSAVLPQLLEALADSGLSDEDVRAVAGENFRRILLEVLPT